MGCGASALSLACEYQPFELKLKSESTTRSTSTKPDPSEKVPLKFAAQVVSDAKTVYSDTPYFTMNVQSGLDTATLGWNVSENDTQLSKENTLTEFYGYLTSYLGIQVDPKKFMVQENISNFLGVGPSNLSRVAEWQLNPEALAESDKTIAALRKSLAAAGNKSALASNPKEVPHFAHPAFMTSDTLRKNFGDSTLLLCMSMAYARDAFEPMQGTPEEIKKHEKLVEGNVGAIAAATLRGSIVDMVAAQALSSARTDPNWDSKFQIDIASGTMKCGLTPTLNYSLVPVTVRCPTSEPAYVSQKWPVVRGTAYDDRYVQIGDKLFNVTCSLNGNSISISDSGSLNAAAGGIMAQLTKKANPPAGSQLQQIFKNNSVDVMKAPTDPKTKEYVTKLAAACDEALTGKAQAPGVPSQQPQQQKAPPGIHSGGVPAF